MGAYTLLQDLTVATNSTSVVLDDFGTITKDDFVKVVFTHVNGSASNCSVRLLAESSVNTNYHVQGLIGSSSSVFAFRANENRFARTTASTTSSLISYVKLSGNDRLNIFTNTTLENTSSLSNQFLYTTSSGATFASGITEFTLTASVTNGIGTGSRIQIYKLAAEKVADFVTTTNSTQVNIPFPTGTFSPAIDKDSEYLLVSDIVGGASLGSNFVLAVNDITATNQYYYQVIGAFGSTTYAVRENQGLLTDLGIGQRSLTHSHIKLSNIGAFTAQNYNMKEYGTTTPSIFNRFQSSIAENITSISKINIVASRASGIGTGSRFILYKLYK